MRGTAVIAALVLLAAACSSPSRPAQAPRPATTVAAPADDAPAGATDARVPTGQDAVESAYALWTKMKVNAEKALAAGPDDPNRGWLDRALESDGRALVSALGSPAFDSFPATRDEVRARVLFVIKPPAPEDRREAIKAVEDGFVEILKRHRRG
jgi:hypothetical protein